MKPGPRTRRILLFGALGLTLAAVRWVDGEADVNSAGAATRREPAADIPPAAAGGERRVAAKAGPVPDAAAAIDLTRLRRNAGAKAVDAFGAHNWDPPPRKPSPRELKAQREAAVAALPPLPLPPLPYAYLGMLDGDDGRTVFLELQDRSLAARKGDVLDGTWRVDDATDARILFTFLPLDRQMTLSIGTP